MNRSVQLAWQRLMEWDQRFGRFAFQATRSRKWVKAFVRAIGTYSPHVFFLEMGAWLTFCIASARPLVGAALTGIGGAVTAALLTKVAIDAIALRFGRQRPFVRWGVAPIIPKSARDPSFPSNHAGGAFALAVSLAWWIPSLAVLSLCLAVLLAMARVMAGLHYVSDVLVGAAVGALVATLLMMVLSGV